MTPDCFSITLSSNLRGPLFRLAHYPTHLYIVELGVIDRHYQRGMTDKFRNKLYRRITISNECRDQANSQAMGCVGTDITRSTIRSTADLTSEILASALNLIE